MAQLPPWQPLDGGAWVPDGEAGRIIAIVASEAAVEGGWAATAALDIARSWSGAGAKVVLADGALHYPALHTHARVDNREGLSDAALFGASIGRVARPVDEGAFFLITAGTAVANANSVPSAKRWSHLLQGFVEAGVQLLLFLRDGDSGCAAFLGSASDIVVLAAEGEKAPGAVRDIEGLVRTVTGVGAASPEPSAGVRPPAEWTAGTRPGRRRVMLLAAAVVALVLLLVVLFSVMGFSGPPPGQSGSLLTPSTHGSASVLA